MVNSTSFQVPQATTPKKSCFNWTKKILRAVCRVRKHKEICRIMGLILYRMFLRPWCIGSWYQILQWTRRIDSKKMKERSKIYWFTKIRRSWKLFLRSGIYILLKHSNLEWRWKCLKSDREMSNWNRAKLILNQLSKRKWRKSRLLVGNLQNNKSLKSNTDRRKRSPWKWSKLLQ